LDLSAIAGGVRFERREKLPVLALHLQRLAVQPVPPFMIILCSGKPSDAVTARLTENGIRYADFTSEVSRWWKAGKGS
jgi:hypothetical protein